MITTLSSGWGGTLPDNPEFALFVHEEKGPFWRGFYSDLEEAKRRAQELANEEGFEFFIFRFKDKSEIARFFPAKHSPARTPKERRADGDF